MVLQARYRLFNRLTLNGNYTIQFRNHGNYEGEGTNTPGYTSIIGDYPEALSEARHYPEGRLQNFQRHKLRAWAIYDMDMGRAGNMSVSGWCASTRAWPTASRSAASAPTATQRSILTAAGYPDQLGTANVFFAERGSEMFAGYGLLDTSIHYNVPLFGHLRPWIKFDVYNMFNNQKLVAWSTTVSQNAATPARRPRHPHRLHAGGVVRQGDRQHRHEPEHDGDPGLPVDGFRRHQRQRRPHVPRCDGTPLLTLWFTQRAVRSSRAALFFECQTARRTSLTSDSSHDESNLLGGLYRQLAFSSRLYSSSAL